jgi:hypothetical protein
MRQSTRKSNSRRKNKSSSRKSSGKKSHRIREMGAAFYKNIAAKQYSLKLSEGAAEIVNKKMSRISRDQRELFQNYDTLFLYLMPTEPLLYSIHKKDVTKAIEELKLF